MKYTKFPGRVMFGALNVMSDFFCSIECEAKKLPVSTGSISNHTYNLCKYKKISVCYIQYI